MLGLTCGDVDDLFFMGLGEGEVDVIADIVVYYF